MMTNKLGAVAVMAIGAFVGACTAGSTDEGKTDNVESSSDALSASCLSRISERPGTAEWRAALDECIAEARAEGGGAATPSAGGGQSCSISTSCINGACTCGSGPAQGQSCDGSVATGAESCSVKCRYCR